MLVNDDTIIDLKPEPALSTRVVAVRPEMDVEPEFLPPAPPPAPKRPPVGRNWWIVRVALLVAMLCFAAVFGHWGVVLRDSLFEPFRILRHTGDIDNAFNQGTFVNDSAWNLAVADGAVDPNSAPAAGGIAPWRYVYRAFVKRFDDAAAAAGERGRYEFDYVPARLLMATLWVRDVRQRFPNVPDRVDSFDFTRFMLRVNTFLGALTSLAMFLLVRHWVLRAGTTPGPGIVARAWGSLARLRAYAWSTTALNAPPPPLPDLRPRRTIKAWTLGFVAATLVWFEPNILLESHIWPQWDLWIVPFFVLACWLASANWWYAAGLSLGVGAMLKGQMLFGAPLLLLWPIFDARPGALARLLTGFATSFLAIAAPWLIQTREAGGVVLMGVGAAAVLLPFYWMRRKAWVFGVISAVTGIAVLTPFLFTRDWGAIGLGLLLMAMILSGPWLFSKRSAGVWVMAIATCSTILAAMYWGGTMSWWKIGFEYGTRHYDHTMYMGPSVNNLSAVLHDTYKWDLYDKVFSVGVPEWLANALASDPSKPRGNAPPLIQKGQLVVTIKVLLTAIFVTLMPVCAWAAARHARRNDPRFLVAITAPWVILFAVMAQMHERYLFWAAIIGTCAVGVSLGMTFLWLVVSLLSFSMILHCQLRDDPNTYRMFTEWFDLTLQNTRWILNRAHPGLGWLMMLLACVYLYMAVTSSRKSDGVAPLPLSRRSP